MAQSEVVQFRQQQALQEQAAQQGLYGLAVVSRHDFIEARMERGAERLLQLIKEGKHEEVKLLMETEAWALEGEAASRVKPL
jgi:hypothetical protein